MLCAERPGWRSISTIFSFVTAVSFRRHAADDRCGSADFIDGRFRLLAFVDDRGPESRPASIPMLKLRGVIGHGATTSPSLAPGGPSRFGLRLSFARSA